MAKSQPYVSIFKKQGEPYYFTMGFPLRLLERLVGEPVTIARLNEVERRPYLKLLKRYSCGTDLVFSGSMHPPDGPHSRHVGFRSFSKPGPNPVRFIWPAAEFNLSTRHTIRATKVRMVIVGNLLVVHLPDKFLAKQPQPLVMEKTPVGKLLSLHSGLRHQSGEARQAFLRRMALMLAQPEKSWSTFWESLPNAAQLWVNDAVDAIEADKPLPDFEPELPLEMPALKERRTTIEGQPKMRAPEQQLSAKIDRQLVKRLKYRLLDRGMTYRDWLTRQVLAYI